MDQRGVALAYGDTMTSIPEKNISLKQLEELFANIRKAGKWNLSGDLLWGYFFTHHEPKLLEKASIILQKRGYHYVNIFMSDIDDPKAPNLYWLHIEKVETHTPSSLDSRNDEFYLFADEFAIDAYDGMDVGPLD
ncbi:MAG: ribonuclease E inhibitor RraB [Thiohalomonadales bacterium]